MGLSTKAVAVLAALAASITATPPALAGSSSSITGTELPPVLGQRWPVYRHRRPIVIPYYNGYRGWPQWRSGYRRHANGWWYPLAAFGVEVIIRQPRPYGRVVTDLPPEHYVWCDRRYKTYRVWDDTFQPNKGPGRLCNSPYDGR